MRERSLIEEEVRYTEHSSARATHLAAAQLEVLLDIRDLLQAGEDRIARLEKMAEERRRELQ